MTDSKQSIINIPIAILTLLVVGVLFFTALHRINIDFDVLNSMPTNNTVLNNAKYVFSNHPFQDRIVIDIFHPTVDPDKLVESAVFFENQLKNSGLFKQVGWSQTHLLIPELVKHTVQNMPVLFSADQLEKEIIPLLTEQNIQTQLVTILNRLSNMNSIGQAKLIAEDPLELRNLILRRLSHLSPVKGGSFYRGYPFSADGKHILVIVNPGTSGADTAFSRATTALFKKTARELNQKFTSAKTDFTITPVGAYRAALDNENIVKRDTQRAILFATIGIAVLLFISFPRPFIGLLSLVPAVIGTITAFFVCSLIYDSISILALGFGGAIISITVDHSIAYLLFLDRPHETVVREAAHEVRSIGLIAVLTTVGAFWVLSISGFPILAQIGQFAALGILFSFIFVHTVFPLINPMMPAASKKKTPVLQKLINRLSTEAGYKLMFMATGFFLVMLLFAKPEFNADLSSMNTVSEATESAEKHVGEVWGEVFSKVYLIAEANNIQEIQDQGDRLTDLLDQDMALGNISSAFVPSMLFPGNDMGQRNFKAWKQFWNQKRIAYLQKTLVDLSLKLGFSPNAFEPFFRTIQIDTYSYSKIPMQFFDLLGISHNPETGKWIQFTTVTPGLGFQSNSFFQRYSFTKSIRIFDPNLFSSEFGGLLSSTFQKMILIIGLSVVLLIFVFFLDWKLTIISMLPIIFALVCTLGTLNIMNRPLDIPGLMLAIIVIGMGIDYSLFFVRSYQRYGNEVHPSLGLIRMAVFLASISTIIGFGVLVTAQHNLLRSAGLVSLLGIGYSLIGSFIILPPILRRLFIEEDSNKSNKVPRGKSRFSRVIGRYSKMEAHPRMFARFKILLDPMFSEIEQFFTSPKIVIDIGCGYGVPAGWLMDCYPDIRIFGLDPDPERVRVANRALKPQGKVICAGAPQIPPVPEPADAAMMLDMMHYLSDSAFKQTLQNIHSSLRAEGDLIIRVTLPSPDKTPFFRWFETQRIKLSKADVYYRSQEHVHRLIAGEGFKNICIKPSGKDREETWFTAKADK